MDFLISNQDVPLHNSYDIEDIWCDYRICVNSNSNQKYFYDKHIQDGKMYLFIGKLYTNIKNPASYICNNYLKNDKFLNLDGDFLFIIINNLNEIIFYSDREGIIPVYYTHINNRITLTTNQKLLFQGFTKDDICNQSINDFLRFGTLLGDSTFSKKVKLIEGGTKWKYENNKIRKNRYHLFHFDSQNSISDVELLIDKINLTYSNAIKKRINENEIDNSCIFMSGGIDSRFLLSLVNKVYPKQKIHAYTFGQENSEEVDVARKCSSLHNNPFHWIKVTPRDFIKNINQYARMTCGADMFPQSYIIDVAKQIQKNNFFTGFALDAYLGGTFLNEEVLKTDCKLSDFIPSHLKLLKMNAISDTILKKICKDGIYESVFKSNVKHLIEIAKEYDLYPTQDVIQPFAINNRAKRLVLLREIVPAQYLNYSCISFDRDFLNAVSLIPSHLRNNHYFYQQLFMNVAPDYANIVYNNTTLPISADLAMWNTGTENEYKREKLFQSSMKTINQTNNPLYYPHFYSDFDGYSRYDSNWKQLMEDYLLNESSYINQFWFNNMELKNMYIEHLNDLNNYRKEFIYLTSLEIFLRNFLEN